MATPKEVQAVLTASDIPTLLNILSPEINQLIKSGAKAERGTEKATSLTMGLIKALLTGDERRSLKGMDQTAAVDLVRERALAKKDELQVRQEGRMEEIGAITEKEERLIRAREESRIRTAQAMKEIEQGNAPRTPRAVTAAASANIRSLQRELSPMRRLSSQDAINKQLEVIRQDPAKVLVANSLDAQIAAKRESAAARTQEIVSQKYPRVAQDQGIMKKLTDLSHQTGQPVAGKILERANVAATQGDDMVRRLAAEGVVLREGAVSETGKLPGFRGAGKASVEATVADLEKARMAGTLTPDKLDKGIAGAAQAVRRGRLGRAGIGIAALALLLPKLLGGKKQAEPDPLQQAQLAQTLANLQQQQALAQSLVGQRNAAAAKNEAQANLLRLQALSQNPGLSGGVGLF